ncbi:MAG: hypothetical protein HXX20_10585 [Chloroflexi bacterium]|nr:hypothetical protein [Chloroflexota bacterium]
METATLSLLLLAAGLGLVPEQPFSALAVPLDSDSAQVLATPCPPNLGCASTPNSVSTPLAPEPTVTPSLPKATNSGVKMTVQAGLGQEGYARDGSWLPVYISLENNGNNLRGELSISIAPVLQQDYASRAVPLYTSLYLQRVELSSATRKQLTMYVPYQINELFNRTITVELNGWQDGENQPRNLAQASAELKPLLNQLLVGYFATTPDALRLYNDLTLSNSNTYGGNGSVKHLRVTKLDPARLPNISQALGSLNVLVLEDIDPSILSPTQWLAVESWIGQGGVLLLSGGAGATRVLKNLPSNLQPAALPTSGEIGELDQASLKALEKLGGLPLPQGVSGAKSYLAHLKPLEGATALVTAESGIPLAIELKRGAGAVIITAFDLAEPRFANWSGTSKLWETLVGSYAMPQISLYSAYGISSANLIRGGLTNVLTNIPGVGIPPLKIIAVLVLIYIALVGPGNYLVLRVLRRLELSWITLPLLTILFAGGIYLFALKDKGSTLLTSSISIIRLNQDDNQSKGPLEKAAISLTGVFAPNDSSYILTLPTNSLTSAIPNYIPAASGVASPSGATSNRPIGLRIVQGEQPQIELLGMTQWSFRSVVVEGNVKLAGGLSGQFVQRDDKLTGALTNRTGQPLNDVTVLTAYGVAQLGDLTPGQTVQVELDNLFGTPSPIYSLYQSDLALPYRETKGNFEERIQTRKRELLNSLANSLPFFNSSGYNQIYQAQGSEIGIVALGWSDKPLLEYGINGQTIGGNDLTLFVSELTLDLEKSNQLLPGLKLGKVSEKVTISPSAGGVTSSLGYLPSAPVNGAILEAGSIIVDFDVSPLVQILNQGQELSKLIIEAPAYSFNRTGYGPQQGPNYRAELYNYRSDKWELLPVVLAPTACLKQVPAYTGSPIVEPISGLSQLGAGASQTCLDVSGKGLTAIPAIIPTSIPSAASTSSSATTLTPTTTIVPAIVPAYFPGGSPTGFIVIQPGPGFSPTQYLSPEGKIRARFSRDDKENDVVYWSYFSVGYELR